MATFDKLIQEIGSRYCLGPKAYPLVQLIRPNLWTARRYRQFRE